MNKDIVKIKLKDLIIEASIKKEASFDFATTNIQECNSNGICFYYIHENDLAEKSFYERLESNCVGLLITNRLPKNGIEVDYLIVGNDNFLDAQKRICDLMYPNKRSLKFFGVTGTNGKTTTVNLSVQLSKLSGINAFSIGTLGVFDHEKNIYPEINATTPSYLELRKIIHKFQEDYEACFMEVSSHALVQQRLFDVMLESCAWTSFSQDHLDYHKTLEEYFDAKLLIKDITKNNFFVPSEESDLIKTLSYKEIDFTIVEDSLFEDEVPFSFKPKFNMSNLKLAYKLVSELVSIDESTLKELKLPKGRMSVIKKGNISFVVDYAHTPEALEFVCKSLKEAFPTQQLITVFGCGGDRDRLKRPMMGKAACKYSDITIATSDNPRTEDPIQILNDIKPGLSGVFHVVEDRTSAIKKANELTKGDSIVLIAGKGHEEYQDIGGKKIDYSDFKVVEKL